MLFRSLTVIFWAITMIIPYIVDKFALKRPGYASIGSSSLAGVALSIPVMFSTYMFSGISGSELIKNSVSILAFVLLITNILSPFFTKGIMAYYFKSHQGEKISDVKRVFSESHPELITDLYDTNYMYKKNKKRGI